MNVDEIISDRDTRYGGFDQVSALTKKFKALIDEHGRSKLTDVQSEALDMVVHKMARILIGDPDYEDNWVDIQGYAKLATMYAAPKKSNVITLLNINPSYQPWWRTFV